jgi:hypothetical protein
MLRGEYTVLNTLYPPQSQLKGTSEYLEKILARIDALRLYKFHITFFKDRKGTLFVALEPVACKSWMGP